jgi:hypothetical protein
MENTIISHGSISHPPIIEKNLTAIITATKGSVIYHFGIDLKLKIRRGKAIQLIRGILYSHPMKKTNIDPAIPAR